MQLDSKRPGEGAIENYNYLGDQIDQSGTLPQPPRIPSVSIKMAKHHVISWKILREAWNKADLAGKTFICEGIYKALNKTDVIPESEEVVRQNVCWNRSNLILGPEGAIRLFDPGELLDFEAPSSLAPEDRVRVELLLTFGALLMQYRDPKGNDTEDWKRKFNETLKALEPTYRDLCHFDRSAWKLFTKAKIVWGPAGAGSGQEVKSTTQGFWYRGCVSAECVAKLFPSGATSKNIGTEKLKGERLTTYKLDQERSRQQARTMYAEKLAKDTLHTNSQPAMVLATNELLQ